MEAKSQTISEVYSSERHPCTLFPRLLENRCDKEPRRSDTAAVRRQNKRWRKITQDSSSRVRNLKHPATQCTASSRAPGEGEARWMPISWLFCHAAPPVSTQSCRRYHLYMQTDTSRCGTWVYATHTCVTDAFCLLESHAGSRSERCAHTHAVTGGSLTQAAFNGGTAHDVGL